MKPKSDSGQCGSTNFSFKTTHQAEPVLCFSIIVDCVNCSTLINLSIHILPPSWFKCSCRACNLRQAASRPLNINASSHEVMVAPSLRRCCWQMMGLSSYIENTTKVASPSKESSGDLGSILCLVKNARTTCWTKSAPARRIHHVTCSRLVCCSLRHHPGRCHSGQKSPHPHQKGEESCMTGEVLGILMGEEHTEYAYMILWYIMYNYALYIYYIFNVRIQSKKATALLLGLQEKSHVSGSWISYPDAPCME